MRKRFKARLAGVMAAMGCLLAGCDNPSPATVCAQAETQNDAFNLIFQEAERVLNALGTGNLSGAQLTQVQTELNQMKSEHMLSFDFSTLDAYDKITKRVSCSGKLRLKLSAEDQTKAAQASLSSLASDTSDSGFIAPEGLASGSATTQIQFARQPSAADASQFVYTVDNIKEATAGLAFVAIERAVQHMPKAVVAPSSPDESDASTPPSTAPADTSDQTDGAANDDGDNQPASAPPPPPPPQGTY